MAGLLDFLQGASNAAASNVAGPVDLINAGLLGIGLPMPAAPFGGTQWMRDKGLIRDPQNRIAGLLGEAAGMSLPIVAAAKAPQIARGVLDHAEAYRKYHAATTAPGATATVWHGSPHKFDKFDAAHIGKGEGAQAYGHGLYFADSPAVAADYQRRLSAGSMLVDGKPTSDLPTAFVARKIQELGPEKARAWFQSKAEQSQQMARLFPSAQKDADEFLGYTKLAGDLANKPVASNPGSLYRVDLPDDAIARMLDWDAPLSGQGDTGRKLLPELSAWQKKMLDEPRYFSEWKSKFDNAQTGGVTYGELLRERGGASGAAEYLRSLGIPGIRYLDSGSRGAGAGTSNYDVFPGDEGLLKILGRE